MNTKKLEIMARGEPKSLSINSHPSYDPWRYICPKCGSNDIRLTRSTKYCNGCNTSLETLYDKKKGTETRL